MPPFRQARGTRSSPRAGTMSTFALGPTQVRRPGDGAMQLAGRYAFGTPPDRASACFRPRSPPESITSTRPGPMPPAWLNAYQRGLARPVRAQQAKHHPRRNLQPGTVQRHGRPEALDHTLDPHRRHRRTTPVHPGHWARSRPRGRRWPRFRRGNRFRGPYDLLVVRCHVDLLNRAVRAFAADSGLPSGR
jgi:hypothetical protein